MAEDDSTPTNAAAKRGLLEALAAPSSKVFDFAKTELVRLDRLPFPPHWRAHALSAGHGSIDIESGYGVGAMLNSTLGGGIGRGEALVLGAAGPGAGKTHLLGQWAEGLALRSAAVLERPEAWDPITRTLTPVIVLSELRPETLLGRAVARWTGIDGNAFRQGRHWRGFVTTGDRGELIDAARAEQLANAAIGEQGPLAPLLSWMRRLPIDSNSAPRNTIELVRRAVSAWTTELRAEAAHASFEVVPVVVVDPIQRYQGSDDEEVKALNCLVEGLHDAAMAEGFAVLCTSDTNKDSSSSNTRRATSEREARERGAKVLRGSNKLLHLVDASLYIERDWDRTVPPGFGEIEVAIGKNRYGASAPPFARMRWHLATGRMFPCTEHYCRATTAEPPPATATTSDGRPGHDLRS